jgi:hypothetical protein
LTPSFARLTFLLVLSATLLGCTSPEVSRTRGGGPGADVGNKRDVVRMHEGADPYANTPRLVEARPASKNDRKRDEVSQR